MKKLVLLFWAVATTALYAQSVLAPQVKWHLAKDSISGPFGIVETDNHHFVVIIKDNNNQISLEEIDSLGNISWQTNLGIFPSTFNDLKKTPDGYIMCGTKVVSGLRYITITRTDKNGNIFWNHNYVGTWIFPGLSIDLIGGTAYIVSGLRGYGSASWSKRVPFLMKVDTAGTMLWYKNYYLDFTTTHYQSTNYGIARKVVVLNNGFGQLTTLTHDSYCYNSTAGNDYFLITNASGDSVSTYHFPSTFKPTAVTKSNVDGSIIFIGRNSSDTLSMHSFSTVKLDPSGLFLSRKDFSLSVGNTVENGIFGDIIAKNSGFIAFGKFGGTGCSNSSDYSSFVMRITEGSDTIWTKHINGDVGHSFPYLCCTLTADGGCVIAGSESDSTLSSMFLLKLGPDSIDLQNSVNNFEQRGIDWSIYPNPFNLQTTISFGEEQKNIEIKIFDVFGKEINKQNFTGKQLIMEKGVMQPGIYFVQIIDCNKYVVNRKIIIQ